MKRFGAVSEPLGLAYIAGWFCSKAKSDDPKHPEDAEPWRLFYDFSKRFEKSDQNLNDFKILSR